MAQHVNRRDFTKQTSAILLGLVAGSQPGGHAFADPEPAKPDDRLVLLGLNGLARAPERDYFTDGHRGASLVAAHLLCVENNLDQAAKTRIVELFDRNWASTPLCQSFPDEDADVRSITRIGEALVEGGDVLRQVGHNAIFAMLAIKAFRMLPSAATPKRIDGVCKLIRSFTPWQDGPADKAIDPPPFAESKAISRFILREAIAAIDRFAGYGQGFAGHMLTFGQALVELAAMGDVELAESCRTAFCKYVTVTRRGPDADAKRIPDHKPSAVQPSDAEYWQARGDKAVGIGHVFKYPYSCYDLLRGADDPELTRLWHEKSHHLF